MSPPAGDSRRASRLRSLASLLVRPADSLLALRTLGWMCVLPVLKRTVALPRLVRLMWVGPRGSVRDPEGEKRVIQVVARLSRASGGNCLERSLILYRYLSRAGADPSLVVGMTRSDRYLGHVWVTLDGQALLETSETLHAYAEVTAFGREGRRVV
jgi:hypothetical protein